MSTKQTQNYGLHLWEPEDKFLRTEFNENSTKLDTAIADVRTEFKQEDAKLSAAIQSARSEAAAGLAAKPGIIMGTYTGNAVDTGYQGINLGVRPKAVFVTAEYAYMYFGMITDGNKLRDNTLYITDYGFVAGTVYNVVPILNQNGIRYFYIAFV